jgi:hypothetical protein
MDWLTQEGEVAILNSDRRRRRMRLGTQQRGWYFAWLTFEIMLVSLTWCYRKAYAGPVAQEAACANVVWWGTGCCECSLLDSAGRVQGERECHVNDVR